MYEGEELFFDIYRMSLLALSEHFHKKSSTSEFEK